MSSSASILPQTLQSITSIKLRELRKQRKGFETRRKKLLEDVEDAKDEQARLRILLTGWARMHTSNAEKPLEEFRDRDIQHHRGLSVTNIRRFLEQAQYDPSIPSSLLRELEGDLCRNMDRISRKFDYADLYSRLLTEWLRSDASSRVDIDMPEDESAESAESAFEVVPDTQKTRLLQLSEKFESVVFTPGEVDVTEIEKLLNGLFSDEDCKRALDYVRNATKQFGQTFLVNSAPFGHTILRRCIKGLLHSDLLSEQKKNTLHDFLQDEVVLTEIADVLNMRFADLEGWGWDAEGGIPVEPRRQLNGKYRVVMDEDILQSIFVHYISMSWATHFKEQLRNTIRTERVWRRSHSLPKEEIARREYYLGSSYIRHISQGLAKEREDTYEKHFFMCQLPASLDAEAGDYENDSDSRQKQPLNVKQLLLRTLGTEVMVQRSLHGEVAIVQSDLQWFATSTSHSTVLTVLRFFGVEPVWISFFRRYLEAPLRMIRLEGSSAEVRIRKRGVPIGHVFQKLFGELIIFAMDLAVKQEAEILLYRLHDDLWLCGEPEKCAKAWKTMQRCAQIMGLEFNMTKTGSVCLSEDMAKKDRILAILPKGKVAVGFLELDANSGEWVIDQRQVDAHIQQLQKQLAGCKSVFSWIQTWNSCIGRFFGHTFGQPANCFGRRHVDMILETHRRMQHKLFGQSSAAGNSVTEYLKNLISEHFGIANVPDAFLYFPEELGGLGLRNPFISLLVIRENLERDPPKKLLDFFDTEKEEYEYYKRKFEALNEIERLGRVMKIWGSSSDIKKSVEQHFHDRTGENFMPFNEYIQYREITDQTLFNTYKELLIIPSEHDVRPSQAVMHALDQLNETTPELAWNWNQLGSDQKWIIQLYSSDVLERFGALNLVDRNLLPMGVMKMLRARKVVWQTGL